MMTLLSWNVLTDSYVRPAWYPRVPPALLGRGARTSRVVEKLAASGADVICLQEAEPPLVAAARTALRAFDARYLAKGRGKPDGCALLVRRAAFTVVETRELRYADGSGHVALLAELDAHGRRLGVATTHVKWDAPETPFEARFARRELEELRDAMRVDVPWIVCGDFNIADDDPALRVLLDAGFSDAYGGSPLAGPTVVANGRAARIDFVLTRGIVAAPLPVASVGHDTVLPSDEEPSDHLPIGVQFERPALRPS